MRRSATQYYIPDVFVVPMTIIRQMMARPGTLEAYTDPLPLVVEIWSPSTGVYDVDDKLPEDQRRGDEEIWRIHPYDRTLIAWRRRPDGSYTDDTLQGGAVRPVALSNVVIDLDTLFD